MSETQPVEEGNPSGVSNPLDVSGHYVVVAVDYHEARIYPLDGAGVTRPEKIVPSDPKGRHHNLHTKAGSVRGWTSMTSPMRRSCAWVSSSSTWRRSGTTRRSSRRSIRRWSAGAGCRLLPGSSAHRRCRIFRLARW